MPTPNPHRRLAAIMFTDIVGYTALMQENEQQAIQIRNRHRRIFEEQHRLFHGEILQYFGDGTLSIFQSGIEAVECAIAIQRAAQFKDVIPLRIGLHIGDLVFDGTDIYGDSVNMASRIESMGVAGAVLISQKLNDELHNQAHIETQYLGEYSFKNVTEAIGIFAVKDEHLQLPIPSELKGKRQQPEKSIAVLPFVNRSADPENEYFSDGMTEEIINALSKIEGLCVTSRNSSFYFKDKQLPIAEIGDALNVSTILEGNIRLSKDKLRVTAQLVDVQDDYQFWSERFDRPLDDVFEVQDELSLLIADRLREHLGHLEIDEQLVEAPDISVDLYKQYLKARYLVLKMNKADVQAGIQLLEGIIAEKADFPMAYVGLHQAYTVLATVGFLSAKEAFGKAQQYLDQVLKIEPNLAEVQLNLAWTSLLSEWNFEKTYDHLNKSLEARPTIDYYQSMTGTLAAEGKLEAAMHYIDTGVQIDPFSAVNYHLKGFVFYLMEDYSQAISHFDKSLSLNADFSAPILYKGSSLLLMDKKEVGLDYFEQLPTDRPSLLNRIGGMTLAQAYLNRKAAAEKGIQQLEAALESDSMERAVLLLILCHTALDNTDEAVKWIKQGIDYRLPMLIYLFVDPLLKELRPIPQFQQLMQQVLGERTDFSGSKRKYKKTLFTPEELEQQKAQLEELMTNQQPYLDPNMTLRTLAEQMSLPPNYLSQLLNEGFEQNFSEYINAYRVHTFKAKVADPTNQHLTILALAYDSGFNSKTVFNTFFKKMEGMTPRAYWKKVS